MRGCAVERVPLAILPGLHDSHACTCARMYASARAPAPALKIFLKILGPVAGGYARGLLYWPFHTLSTY